MNIIKLANKFLNKYFIKIAEFKESKLKEILDDLVNDKNSYLSMLNTINISYDFGNGYTLDFPKISTDFVTDEELQKYLDEVHKSFMKTLTNLKKTKIKESLSAFIDDIVKDFDKYLFCYEQLFIIENKLTLIHQYYRTIYDANIRLVPKFVTITNDNIEEFCLKYEISQENGTRVGNKFIVTDVIANNQTVGQDVYQYFFYMRDVYGKNSNSYSPDVYKSRIVGLKNSVFSLQYFVQRQNPNSLLKQKLLDLEGSVTDKYFHTYHKMIDGSESLLLKEEIMEAVLDYIVNHDDKTSGPIKGLVDYVTSVVSKEK